MKKRKFTAVLCMMLCLLLASCGAAAPELTPEPTPAPTPTVTPAPTPTPEPTPSLPEGVVLTGVTFEADDIQPVDVWTPVESIGLNGLVLQHDSELMQFTRDGKVGLVNYEGEIVADAKYAQIGLFEFNYYLLYEDGTCDVYRDGVLREKASLDPYYDVLVGGDFGGVFFWDTDRDELGNASYGEPMYDFSWLETPVVIREDVEEERIDADYSVWHGVGGYGLATKDKILVEPTYAGIVSFAGEGEGDGFIHGAAALKASDGTYVFFDADGEQLTEKGVSACWVPSCDIVKAGTEAYPYHFGEDGFLCMKVGDAFGYTDVVGAHAVPAVFAEARPSYEGLAFVKTEQDGAWQVANLLGK